MKAILPPQYLPIKNQNPHPFPTQFQTSHFLISIIIKRGNPSPKRNHPLPLKKRTPTIRRRAFSFCRNFISKRKRLIPFWLLLSTVGNKASPKGNGLFPSDDAPFPPAIALRLSVFPFFLHRAVHFCEATSHFPPKIPFRQKEKDFHPKEIPFRQLEKVFRQLEIPFRQKEKSFRQPSKRFSQKERYKY